MERKISLFIIITWINIVSSSFQISTECRRDVTFIVESHMTRCTTTQKCNYCWGQFFMDFTSNILDVQHLVASMHVYHANSVVYGCQLDLEKQETCTCTANRWGYKDSTTTSSLLNVMKIAQSDFTTGRPDFGDTIVLIVSSRLSGPVADVARSLHESNIHVVVVGVGIGVDHAELLSLATDKYSLFMLWDKNELLKATSQIQRVVCNSCQKDVTFAMGWDYSSTGRQQLGWCAGGLVSQFVSSIDNQIGVTSVDWTSDGQATGCQMNWTRSSSNCTCLQSHWSTLTPSLLYDNIVNRFSNLRQEYPNVVVLMTDRRIGFTPEDVRLYRDNKVKVVTVGVGNETNLAELNSLATSENVSFTVDTWSDISVLIPDLRYLVCYDRTPELSTSGCTKDRIDITVLVDLSSSMTTHVSSVKTFLTAFVDTLNITTDKHHVTLVTFSSKVKVTIHDAEQRSAVLDVIKDIKPESGSSNLAEAFSKTSVLVQNARRTLSDSGQVCPGMAVVILSDGLSANRSNTMKEARMLKQLGVKLSYVAFGDESTIYENEGMVSNQFVFHEFDSNWTTTTLLDLESEVVHDGSTSPLSPHKPRDCSYTPSDVVMIFRVSQRDTMEMFLKDLYMFTLSSGISAQVHIVYPARLGQNLLPLSPNMTFYPQTSHNLTDIIHDVQTLNIPKGKSTCYIIITDKDDGVPALLFKQVWRLSDTGSKVMAVGVGVDVNHNVLEMVASVPRHAFASLSAWNSEVPKGLWKAYCQSCGFTSPIDLVFYVETSSGTADKWNHILQFLLTSSGNFPISNNNVLVSVVTFGQQILSKFDFKSYTNKMELFNHIHRLKSVAGSSDLAPVKKDAIDVFSGDRGARAGAKKVIVLVMDIMLDMKVDESGEVQIIWFDVSGRNVSLFQSEYLKPKDFYVRANGVNEIITFQKELHHIICRDMS